MTAFIIWAIVGLLIIGIGINAFFSKKPVGFWANSKVVPVTDIKKYNSAVGRLFAGYGAVFILLGTPLLQEPFDALILLSVLGVMLETIIVMIIYTLVIENKYRKK